jgi:hypothetical protein
MSSLAISRPPRESASSLVSSSPLHATSRKLELALDPFKRLGLLSEITYSSGVTAWPATLSAPTSHLPTAASSSHSQERPGKANDARK